MANWRGASHWIGIALFAAGTLFLVTAILIGTGWNIVAVGAMMFSGASTFESAGFVRRKTIERDNDGGSAR